MARRVNPKRLEAAARAGWVSHDIVSVRQAEAMLLACRLFGDCDPSSLHALTLNLRRMQFDQDIVAAIRAERRRLRNICHRYLTDVAMAFWFELAGSGNLHVHCIVASGRSEDEILAILTGTKTPVVGRKKAHKRPSLFHEENAAHIQAFRSTGPIEQEMLRWSWYACKSWWRSARTDDEHKAVMRLFRLVPVALLTGRIGTNRKRRRVLFRLSASQGWSINFSSIRLRKAHWRNVPSNRTMDSPVLQSGKLENDPSVYSTRSYVDKPHIGQLDSSRVLSQGGIPDHLSSSISLKLGATRETPIDSADMQCRRSKLEHFDDSNEQPP